ncbi:hypothetical protein [Streptomyces sp. AC495_CC817]|uniref:hypothetical protein n=1 Tax=Streptomyces sp. AC495_CC817 TaxID=2823900 RepID=UPI001C260BBA|nr:hypothetical protein [Streptomyces sp. AC495_CC817]
MANQLRIEFENGEYLDVTPNLFDTRNFERALRNNRHWGELRDNGMRLQAFKAWSAASRLDLIDLTWDQFYEDPHTPVLAVVPTPEAVEDTDDALEVEGVGEGMPTARSATS